MSVDEQYARVARNRGRRLLDETAEFKVNDLGQRVEYEGRHIRTEVIGADRIARALQPPTVPEPATVDVTPPPPVAEPVVEPVVSSSVLRVLDRIRRNLSRRHR